MQMVRIQIPEREGRVKSVVEMARRGRIVSLPDNVFVVPEPALELLQSLGVAYVELGQEGSDSHLPPLEHAQEDTRAIREDPNPGS